MAAQLPGAICSFLNALPIDTGTLCRAASPLPGPVRSLAATRGQARIVQICEARWEAHKDDCGGFVKAVAADLGISISGLANDIVKQMKGPPWTMLQSGREARDKAEAGAFVVGGLEAKEHGHVVVVVAGPLAHGLYPTAYWGRLGGSGRKAATINWAWNKADRDSVIYARYTGF